MTRSEALDILRRLAGGLACNQAGVARLMERISQADDPEMLRDVLTELGAGTLLDEGAQ